MPTLTGYRLDDSLRGGRVYDPLEVIDEEDREMEPAANMIP